MVEFSGLGLVKKGLSGSGFSESSFVYIVGASKKQVFGSKKTFNISIVTFEI